MRDNVDPDHFNFDHGQVRTKGRTQKFNIQDKISIIFNKMSTESENSTIPYEEEEIDDDRINEILKDDNEKIVIEHMETSPTKTETKNNSENIDTTTKKDQKVDFENCSSFNPFQVMDLFRSVFSQQGLQRFPPCESTTSTKTTKSNDIKICQNTPRTNVSKGKRKVCTSNDNRQTEHSSSSGKKENMLKNKKQKVDDDEVSIPSQSDIDKKVNKLLDTSESSDSGSSEEEEWRPQRKWHQRLRNTQCLQTVTLRLNK